MAWLYVVSSAAVFDITVFVHSQEGDVRHKLPHKQAMLVSLGAFSQVYMQSSSVHSSACLKLNRSILTATLPLLGYPHDDWWKIVDVTLTVPHKMRPSTCDPASSSAIRSLGFTGPTMGTTYTLGSLRRVVSSGRTKRKTNENDITWNFSRIRASQAGVTTSIVAGTAGDESVQDEGSTVNANSCAVNARRI